MTEQHRAKPEVWTAVERWCKNDMETLNCILELRDRVEALEAARWAFDQQRVRSSPESPLVERVADAIVEQATSAGIVNDRPARAAILQIAMWLREQGIPASDWVMRLEQEASA